VPYAVLFSAVISLDNWAFRYIQVTFYEILKSFHPAILLVCMAARAGRGPRLVDRMCDSAHSWMQIATLAAGLEQFSFLLVAVVTIICTGLAVASVGEVAFSAIGMAMILSAISLSSVSQVCITLPPRGEARRGSTMWSTRRLIPRHGTGGQVLEQKMLHGKERPRIHPMVLLHKTMPISFAVLVPVVSCVLSSRAAAHQPHGGVTLA
jgi:hypothetical protein